MTKDELKTFLIVTSFLIILGFFISLLTWIKYKDPMLKPPCAGNLSEVKMEYYESGNLKSYSCK